MCALYSAVFCIYQFYIFKYQDFFSPTLIDFWPLFVVVVVSQFNDVLFGCHNTMKHIFLLSTTYLMHPNQYASSKSFLFGYNNSCDRIHMSLSPSGRTLIFLNYLSELAYHPENKYKQTMITKYISSRSFFLHLLTFFSAYIVLSFLSSLIVVTQQRLKMQSLKHILDVSKRLKSPSWDTVFLLLQILFL